MDGLLYTSTLKTELGEIPNLTIII